MKTLVHFAVFVVSLSFLQPAQADDARAVVVKQIMSTTRTASGQPILLPKVNARVSVSEFTIAPGAKLPVHKHPYPRFAYVLEGNLSVTDEDTGQTFVYKTGDMIVEVVNQWHYGTNIGQSPVRLLVVDEIEGNQSNTILRR